MGKALLIIVLGAGFLLARAGFNNQVTERESRKDQVEYEEEVLAREISRSAFNVAMGIAREYPNSLDAGANAVDMADEKADGLYNGTARGGMFAVRAETLTGHTLKVTSTGYYGGVWETDSKGEKRYTGESYTMWDTFQIRVLEVREDGVLDTSFLESQAGYCSAIYMDEYRGDEFIGTRMIFAAGHNRDGVRPPVSIYVQAGTQLNFFIGVDTNCSGKFSTSASTCQALSYVLNDKFNPSDVGRNKRYDHLHYALDIPARDITKMEEGIWGMVEQNPRDRQRWRIGWEDLERSDWDRPNSSDPQRSLQALKRLGYDGNGWPDRNSMGYRALRDYGNRPDYSDQVIELGISALRSQAARDSLWYAMYEERSDCGITNPDGMPPEPQIQICDGGEQRMVGASVLQSYLNAGATEGACPEREYEVCHNGSEMTVLASALSGHLQHGDTQGACPIEEEVLLCHDGQQRTVVESQVQSHLNHGDTRGTCPDEVEEEDDDIYDCPCSNSQLNAKKVGILHRPPGNPANEQLLCISKNGWRNGHKPRHDDVLVCGNG